MGMVRVREVAKMVYSAWKVEFVWVSLDLFERPKKGNINVAISIL